MPISSDGWMQ